MGWHYCMILSLSLLWLEKCEAKLEDNGYREIAVSKRHQNFEDKNLIEKVKSTMWCFNCTFPRLQKTDSRQTVGNELKRSTVYSKWSTHRLQNSIVKLRNFDDTKPYDGSLNVTTWPKDILEQQVCERKWIKYHEILNGRLKNSVRDKLKKYSNAVKRARVTAKLAIPNGSSGTTEMKDDGNDGNMVANDTINVVQFPVKIHPGQYLVANKMTSNDMATSTIASLNISSTGGNGDRRYHTGLTDAQAKRLGLGKARSKFHVSEFVKNDDKEPEEDKVDNAKVVAVTLDLPPMERESVVSGAVIPDWFFDKAKLREKLRNNSRYWSPGVLKPSVVWNDNGLFTLQWKTPKDVGSIELRADTNRDILRNSFPNAFKFDSKYVREGSLDIILPETVQRVTVELPPLFSAKDNTMKSVYFGLLAVDRNGRIISHPEVAQGEINSRRYIKAIEKEKRILRDKTDTEEKGNNGNGESEEVLEDARSGTGKWWGVGIIISVIIVAVIAAVAYGVRKILKK